jgi:hypothetical protein
MALPALKCQSRVTALQRDLLQRAYAEIIRLRKGASANGPSKEG